MAQTINLSRRNLFRGRPGAFTLPLRPPGAIPESIFTDTCTACGECVAVCPQGIIFAGSGTYPEVAFRRGECTFCARCIEVCPENALSRSVQPVWQLELRIEESCLAQRQVVCQTCGDACEAEAVSFLLRPGTVATPLIDQDVCTGCGACVAACPENALQVVSHG